MKSQVTSATDELCDIRERIRPPVLACIADDITGASDCAVNLANVGWRVVQVIGVPDAMAIELAGPTDAIVISLKTRSAPKPLAIAQTVDSVRVMKAFGIDRFYFKYCSTFDSTRAGNIGPVAEALLDELNLAQTIFCPAFPRAGRTVYQGHLFVGNRLLNQSGMEKHPLTPMTDSNLVAWLSQQCYRTVGLLDYAVIAAGAESCAAKLVALENAGFALVVADACDDSHLTTLANSVATCKLVTGGSGLAGALAKAYVRLGMLENPSSVPELPRVAGRALVIAGSCSDATRAQVQHARSRLRTWMIDVPATLANPGEELTRLIQWAKESNDDTFLVSSAAESEQVARWHKDFGQDAVSNAMESFHASVAERAVRDLGVRRLVVAGGETSGAVIERLGVKTLRIGSEICPGVPWTEALGHETPLAIAFKSGNFGSVEFFQQALAMLP